MSDPPSSDSKGKRSGTTTLDYIGLGLLLAPPAVLFDIYIRGEPIDFWRTGIATPIFWVAGGLVVWASKVWPLWPPPTNWGAFFSSLVAAENKWWGKAIIIAMSMVGTLVLSSFLSTKTLNNPSPAVTPKPLLSYEDVNYREHLRQLILSNVSEINASFWKFMSGIENLNVDNAPLQQRDKIRSLFSVFDDVMNYRFGAYYRPLSEAANKPATEIDAKGIGSLLQKYLQGYRDTQNDLAVLLKWTNTDPKQGDVGKLFKDWVNADNRGLAALHDLKAFPQSTSLAASMDDGFFVSSNGSLTQPTATTITPKQTNPLDHTIYDREQRQREIDALLSVTRRETFRNAITLADKLSSTLTAPSPPMGETQASLVDKI